MAQAQIFKGTARAQLYSNDSQNYIYHRTAVVKRFDNDNMILKA